jgi:hypothetical protein
MRLVKLMHEGVLKDYVLALFALPAARLLV